MNEKTLPDNFPKDFPLFPEAAAKLRLLAKHGETLQSHLLHLFFLASVPENPDLKTLESYRRDSERFALEGKVFYLHAPDGIGRSKVAARAERALGVAATARNWRSVGKTLAMAEERER